MTFSTALVTGGTGYIGIYVVKTLLDRGHAVHTTVRSLKNAKKLKPLLDLQAQFPQKLALFEADLLKEGSFKGAMQGCEVVFHVASPFLTPQQVKDPQKELVEPAVAGTKNVLDSVNETASVKRVVLTSSVAAMFGDAIEVAKTTDGTLRESMWNTTSSVHHNAYQFSKVEAERYGWKTSKAQKQQRWDLVVINPGLVLGPSMTPDSDSGSLHLLENMYGGSDKMGALGVGWPLVDVRDVALAHVLAGENPRASGRYLVSASDKMVSLLEMADLVRPFHANPRVLPTRNLPKLLLYFSIPFMNGLSKAWIDNNVNVAFKVDGERARRELGLQMRPLEETFHDHYDTWTAKQAAAAAKA